MTTEEILAECLSAIQEQGKTVEECLSRYPAQRADLEPLLRLAALLEQARHVVAPSAYRQVAPARMQNLLAAHPQTARRSTAPLRARQWWPRLFKWAQRPALSAVLPLLFVVLLVLGGGGTLVASANALPNERLYTVKTTVEAIRLANARDEAAECELLLSFAEERLNEISQLIEQEQPEAAQVALDRYTAQVQEAIGVAEQSDSLDRRVLTEQISENLARHEAQLATLAEELPETVQPALNEALDVSRQRPSDPGGEQPGGVETTPIPALTNSPSPILSATRRASFTPRPTGTQDGSRRLTPSVLPTGTRRPASTASSTAVPQQVEESGQTGQPFVPDDPESPPVPPSEPTNTALPPRPTDTLLPTKLPTETLTPHPSETITATIDVPLTLTPTVTGTPRWTPTSLPTATSIVTATITATVTIDVTPELTPTITPTITETPVPTRGPQPSETPQPTIEVPTPTAVPEPTWTPEPTTIPEPTWTPEPTSTVEPTWTPEPTTGHEPTWTPEPTPDSLPTQEPNSTEEPYPTEEPTQTPEPPPTETPEPPPSEPVYGPGAPRSSRYSYQPFPSQGPERHKHRDHK